MVDHSLGQGLALGTSEVQCYRTFVAVGREVISAFGGFGAIDVKHKGGAVFSSIVAKFGSFDLDDIGAEIAQDLCATRSCQNARQIKHANSIERAAHRSLETFSIIWEFLIKFLKSCEAVLLHFFVDSFIQSPNRADRQQQCDYPNRDHPDRPW